MVVRTNESIRDSSDSERDVEGRKERFENGLSENYQRSVVTSERDRTWNFEKIGKV